LLSLLWVCFFCCQCRALIMHALIWCTIIGRSRASPGRLHCQAVFSPVRNCLALLALLQIGASSSPGGRRLRAFTDHAATTSTLSASGSLECRRILHPRVLDPAPDRAEGSLHLVIGLSHCLVHRTALRGNSAPSSLGTLCLLVH